MSWRILPHQVGGPEVTDIPTVACGVCGVRRRLLTWKHVRMHGLTVDEYKDRFGPLCSAEYVARAKEICARPEVKQKLKSGVAHSWTDQGVRARRIAGLRASGLRSPADRRARISATVTQLWQTDDYRHKVLMANRSPEGIARRKAAMREIGCRPEEIERRRLNILNEDPQVRARRLSASKESHNTPAYKAQARRRMLQMLASGAFPTIKTKVHSRLVELVREVISETEISSTLEIQTEYPWRFYSLDIVLVDRQTNRVIELDIEANGCFWHGCEKCYPMARQNAVVRDRVARDKGKLAQLMRAGWYHEWFWEHEVYGDPEVVRARLRGYLNQLIK